MRKPLQQLSRRRGSFRDMPERNVTELEPSPEVVVHEAASDARPWMYGLMIAPSAVLANGVVQGGVLAYLLSVAGIGSGVQSHLIFVLALRPACTSCGVRLQTFLCAAGRG